MILEIRHETRLVYTEPVTESLCELRMEPVSNHRQSCHSFHLAVNPSCERFRYLDGFQNIVHHFNHIAPHRDVRILAASVVVTKPHTVDLNLMMLANYPLVEAELELVSLSYLALVGPVQTNELLMPILEELRPRIGESIMAIALRVAQLIHKRFVYEPMVTHAGSTIADVLSQGKGVCQDFAHLMIAIMRSFGIPTRYVSGYLHRPGRESQSHAWVEVWVPDVGWIGIDPTNNCLANENFVVVGTGRDYGDVTPNKGLYRGKAGETISVRVDSRELDSLPPLSWQEQLPPLQVELSVIASRPGWAGTHSDLEQQQQQQQQQ